MAMIPFSKLTPTELALGIGALVLGGGTILYLLGRSSGLGQAIATQPAPSPSPAPSTTTSQGGVFSEPGGGTGPLSTPPGQTWGTLPGPAAIPGSIFGSP
jgi:hypothetical protein